MNDVGPRWNSPPVQKARGVPPAKFLKNLGYIPSLAGFRESPERTIGTLVKKTISGLSLCLVSAIAALCPAFAQSDDPFSIRVQSNLVLIHAEVYDKQKSFTQEYLQCRINSMHAFYSLPASQPFTPPDCYHFMVMHDLTAGDFHVLENGVEQKIETATYQREALFTVRDNRGIHLEWSHTPQAKWGSVDIGPGWIPAPSRHFYQLSYVPSKAAKGECRIVKVSAAPPGAVVYATDQYCYVANPATDPLDGTKFGKQMEADLRSQKKPRIPLSAQVGFIYPGAQLARIELVLGFPWNHLKYHETETDLHASIGVVGVVYNSDGTVATRFSDFACCSSATRWLAHGSSIAGNLPSRYETQLQLRAGGEYELRVVLSDGQRFGRAVIPLKVDAYDDRHLTVSSVVLCDRFRDAKVAAEEEAEVQLAPRYVPLASKYLRLTPASQTGFKSTTHPVAYFEVYEPLLGEESKTEVKTHARIVDAQTGETTFDFDPADSTSYERAGSRVVAFAGDLSIARLSKGNYRLEVQVTDGRSTALRSASFTME